MLKFGVIGGTYSTIIFLETDSLTLFNAYRTRGNFEEVTESYFRFIQKNYKLQQISQLFQADGYYKHYQLA